MPSKILDNYHTCVYNIVVFINFNKNTAHRGSLYRHNEGGGWRGVTFVHQAQTDNSKFALASYKYLNYKL